MKRFLLLVFLFVACRCASTDEAVSQAAIREATSRNVLVQYDGDAYCSGFIYKTGIVISAGHCFGDNLTVNNAHAVVLKREYIKDQEPSAPDLIAFSVHTSEYEPLIIEDAQVAQRVFSISNRAPWTDVYNEGYVARKQGGWVCATILSVPGYSGSALLSRAGHVLGVVAQMNSAIDTHTNPDKTTWKSSTVMWSWAVDGAELKRFIASLPETNNDSIR